MLRIHARTSAQGTKQYYKQALSTSDYYTEKGEIVGEWRGLTAQAIGLSGSVSEDQFNKLCDNINPIDNEKLTQRTNKNRRIAYDFTFSAPKTISIAYALNNDPNILEAFQHSYLSAMEQIEFDVETRVRKNGQQQNRKTKNVLYSDYIHSTTRPLSDGIPDPHLHAHCVLMNVTHDPKENKFKAIELGDIHKNRQYYEAIFNNSLANNLSKVGYAIERTKNSFKLSGVSPDTEKKFSRRTQEIELLAKEKGITSDKEKEKLGARTRKRKSKDFSFTDLKKIWRSKVSDSEAKSLKPSKSNKNQKRLTASQLVANALDHALERKSAVEEKELLTYAFKQSAGSVDSLELKKALNDKKIISKQTKDGKFYTTSEAIKEEKYLINTARSAKGKHSPINSNYKVENKEMSTEQKLAVNNVLKSKDLINVVAGGAGTGKTWSVKEIANGARKAGRRFHAFAPSSAASRGVQVQEGFENATTIASLLQSKKLQQNLKDGIIWIDEAGMVSNKDMNSIFSIAKQQDARILLTGDINQHNSVERGDALRVLQEKAKVQTTTIKTIRRQQTKDYRQAVGLISTGDIQNGFKALDKIGAIKESANENEVFNVASNEYIDAREQKQETLIVATTHKQGKAITGEIRKKLKDKNILTGNAKTFNTNESANYTESEKKDILNYETGQIVSFHKPGKGGFLKGNDYKIDETNQEGLILSDSKGNKKPLSLSEAERFTVYNQKKTELLEGDLIRMTKNTTSIDSKRVNNGDILMINGFTKEGDIKATRGRTNLVLGKEQGHFTHGYYTTSPSSQGKSVNKVIVIQNSSSGRAANKEQFYVSSSRGRFEISVHTDNKRQMLSNIQRSSQRMSATDLVQTTFKESIKKKIDALKQITRAKFSKAKEQFYNKNLSSIIQKPVKKTITHVIKR